MAYQSGTMLRVIGAFKLVKALMLVAAGIGMLAIGPHTLAGQINQDAGTHYLTKLLAKLSAVSPHRLHELGIACFVYAALFATEGIGLWLRNVWAEYLTTIITVSFIPLEVWELVEHRSLVKAAVIVVNIAIVVYLVLRLRRDKHWPFL